MAIHFTLEETPRQVKRRAKKLLKLMKNLDQDRDKILAELVAIYQKAEPGLDEAAVLAELSKDAGKSTRTIRRAKDKAEPGTLDKYLEIV